MNPMKHFLRKIFSPSTVTLMVCVAIALGVVTCAMAFTPKPTMSYTDFEEVTRIVAPDDIVDTYAYPAVKNQEEIVISSPEFTSPETTSLPYSNKAENFGVESLPETLPQVSPSPIPETTPETAFETPVETTAEIIQETTPETEIIESVPETMIQPAPETTIETAPETTAEKIPETAPAATPIVENSSNAQSELLADKYNVAYTVEKPNFTVTENELKLAAAIIQLEVMGGGSDVEAFQDKTEKYEEMLMVAEVIRNRVDSDKFPNTVEEVINQKVGGVAQFSPVEKLQKALDNGKVTESAFSAAREALVEGIMVKPNNLCYFCATYRKEYFESTNSSALVPDGNGSYVQWEGHLTTFYAGNING